MVNSALDDADFVHAFTGHHSRGLSCDKRTAGDGVIGVRTPEIFGADRELTSSSERWVFEIFSSVFTISHSLDMFVIVNKVALHGVYAMKH
jgi:hypothetical protein